MRNPAFIPPCIAFILTLLLQLPFFDLWFSFMDEGHMLQFADIARKGGEFYRDATFYPLPGAFHFLSLVSYSVPRCCCCGKSQPRKKHL